jgi:hypothetical protein
MGYPNLVVVDSRYRDNSVGRNLSLDAACVALQTILLDLGILYISERPSSLILQDGLARLGNSVITYRLMLTPFAGAHLHPHTRTGHHEINASVFIQRLMAVSGLLTSCALSCLVTPRFLQMDTETHVHKLRLEGTTNCIVLGHRTFLPLGLVETYTHSVF